MVGMINAPASTEDKALALLNFLADKAAAAKAIAEFSAAKAAAEAKIAEATLRAKELAEREAAVGIREEVYKREKDALARDAYDFGFEVDQLEHEKEMFKLRVADWEKAQDQQAKALAAREATVAKTEASQAKKTQEVASREQAAGALKAQYEALLAGAKQLLGG